MAGKIKKVRGIDDNIIRGLASGYSLSEISKSTGLSSKRVKLRIKKMGLDISKNPNFLSNTSAAKERRIMQRDQQWYNKFEVRYSQGLIKRKNPEPVLANDHGAHAIYNGPSFLRSSTGVVYRGDNTKNGDGLSERLENGGMGTDRNGNNGNKELNFSRDYCARIASSFLLRHSGSHFTLKRLTDVIERFSRGIPVMRLDKNGVNSKSIYLLLRKLSHEDEGFRHIQEAILVKQNEKYLLTHKKADGLRSRMEIKREKFEGVKSLNMPLNQKQLKGKKCAVCGNSAKVLCYFGKSY